MRPSGSPAVGPFWPAQLTALLAILLYITLPEKLTVGPMWLLRRSRTFCSSGNRPVDNERACLRAVVLGARPGRAGDADARPDRKPDFLFPQMSEPQWAKEGWTPRFVDYLYVSMTNATAFSPTDTMPLSPLARILMGAQGLGSLVTIGLVVARVVNILG